MLKLMCKTATILELKQYLIRWRHYAIFILMSLTTSMAAADQYCPSTAALSISEKMNMFKNQATYPNFSLVCAHRGMWFKDPENSAGAIETAIENHIDCVENDIRMTKDGHLVVFHDSQVDAKMYRYSDSSPVTGLISSFTLAELKSFRYLDRDSQKTESSILTLSEFFQITNDRILVNHEVKDKGLATRETYRALIQQTIAQGRMEQTIFKGRLPRIQWLDIIDGIVEEDEIFYVPVIMADATHPGPEARFREYKNYGYKDFELVIQSPESSLLPFIAEVKELGGRLGQFDTIPETGRGSYWQGNWVDPNDFSMKILGHRDYRTDWRFLINTSKSDFFISDRACLLTNYLARMGLRDPTPVRTRGRL